jgi:hypothetical protein
MDLCQYIKRAEVKRKPNKPIPTIRVGHAIADERQISGAIVASTETSGI